MVSGTPDDLTAVLHAVRDGDAEAEQVLFERVYDELRRIAHGRIRREHHNLTLLQTNDLVHEAYLRLVRKDGASFENRNHFFGAAVEAMRRILVEYARKRDALRRGGGAMKVTLPDDLEGPKLSFEILTLNRALDRLVEFRPRAARVVGYRKLLGMTVGETAELLRVSPRTVNDDLKFANAWLRREIAGSSGDERTDAT